MRPVTVSKSLTAASDNAVALNQALVAAGNLLLNGATGNGALTGGQRRIIITSSGDDHLVNATVSGTDDYGATIQDKFVLTNGGIAQSNLNFASVSKVALDAAAAANVKVGTNGVGSSPWQVVDTFLDPQEISFWMAKVGAPAVNATLEYTYEPLMLSPIGVGAAPGYGGVSLNPTPVAHPQLQNVSANQEGAIDYGINAWRLTINSGTGQFNCTARQAGLAAA